MAQTGAAFNQAFVVGGATITMETSGALGSVAMRLYDWMNLPETRLYNQRIDTDL